MSLAGIGLAIGCGSGDSGKPNVLVGNVSGDGELPDGMMHHEGRSPDAPARVDRTPVVVDDADEIRKTHQAYEKALDQRYAAAIEQVKSGGWVFMEHTRALKARPEKAKTDLQQIMNDASLPAKSQAKAAEVLVQLEVPSGADFLWESLKSSDAEVRLAAINCVGQYDIRHTLVVDDNAERILKLLNDPDPRVVEVASRLAWSENLPGAEVAMRKALTSGDSAAQAKLAGNLAHVATQKETVEAILPYVLEDTSDEYDWNVGFPFHDLIENGDPAVAEPIRKKLYEYTLKFPSQRYDQSLVRDLAIAAGPDAKDVLTDIKNNAEDAISRLYATEALARLQPEQAVDLYLAYADQNRWRIDVSRGIAKHAKPSDFERISQRLLKAEQPWDSSVVVLCYDKLGQAGKQFIQQHADRLDPNAQSVAHWKAHGLDLKVALDEFNAAGIIPQTPDELLEEMAQPTAYSDGPTKVDMNDPFALIGALATAEILVMFDAESGKLPCDHDQLLLDYARSSQGKFAPESPIQFWLREGEDDYDGPYMIQLVADGRLFRCGAENYGDWYDVEAVTDLVNFTLAETGHPQRFIPLETGDQMASLVFADPAKFMPLAKKYRIAVSEDETQAMQQGRAFEQQVLESYQ